MPEVDVTIDPVEFDGLNAVDVVQALLFVADSPASLSALAEGSGLTDGQIEQALEVLEHHLKQSGPLQLVRLAGGFQLSTKAQFGPAIAHFLKPQRQRMGRSLMEVLAIVAYRQPITAAEVDAVRGVQSDYGLRSLLERRFIQEVGRKTAPGRPVLYGTTQQFLHQFNLNGLGDLPELTTQRVSAEDVVNLSAILPDKLGAL